MSKSNRYFIYSNPMLFPPKETNEFFRGIADILEGTPGKQRGDLVFCAARKFEGEILTSTGERVVVHSFVASSLYRWVGEYWECVLPGNLRRSGIVKENGKYIGEE